MALPPITSQCWMRLATGGLRAIRTDNLGTHMLAKRMEASPASPMDKAKEIYAYYSKWEKGLEDEIAQFI